jgi:CRISPR-associated protein Csb1
MTSQQSAPISLETLKAAVWSAAAFRLRTKLNGVGGDGDKIFPPTYAGGVYAVEDRRIDGKIARCALLDSVQSQANRMEEVLQDAFLPSWRELDPEGEAQRCDLPVLAVHVKNHGWITSLTAPHRVHDAIIRDSEIKENGDNVRFRDSAIGKKIVGARVHNATAFYEYCPTALIFGTWDSTAGEGLDSAKVPRAVVSEIVGVDITPGVRTASRIDPLGIRAGSATIYRRQNDENDWTLDETAAAKEKTRTKRFGKGKPSDINHGNVTPDMPRFDHQEIQRQNLGRLADILETEPLEFRSEINSGDGRIQNRSVVRSDAIRIRAGAVKPGGVTMAYALHTWVLSLTQLRRLRFAVDGGADAHAARRTSTGSRENGTADRRDRAARTVLAALALYALTLQQERGYWLRSRCELVRENPLRLEQVGGAGGIFSLGSAEETREILDGAIREAETVGLKWSKRVIVLTPTEELRQLVESSDALDPDAEKEEQVGAGAAS